MTRGQCLVAGILPRLTDADAAVLDGWLTNGRDSHGRRVSADKLSAALQACGHTVGPTTLKDHRAGRCACQRG